MKKTNHNFRTTHVALMAFLTGILMLASNAGNAQTVTTDKVDYLPGDMVIVSGKGWQAYETVNLLLTEQELLDPGWTDLTKTVVCNSNGEFSDELYELVNADLGAFFHITATGLTSEHVSTITFNDAGGDYGIDFSAYDPNLYDSYNILNVPVAPIGNGSSPLGLTSHSNTKESLMPQYLALGQIVAYEYFVRVDGSGACSNDKIRIEGEFLTVTTNGGLFGFEKTPVNLFAAFVDSNPTDVNFKDGGATATVTGFGAEMDGDAVVTWVEIEGMDPGDEIIVELWVVLQDEIAMSVGGNVKTRLSSAAAIGTCEPGKINTGNQEVPLLQVGDFYTTDVDISVVKTDNPDLVNPGDEITYTIVVNNAGPSVANDVVLTDIMDPNVTYVPDSWSASSSIPENNVMWQDINLSGQTIQTATENIYMKIGETVTITYRVTVNQGAPATQTGGTGSAGSCDGRTGDLLNFVSVTTISDDIVPGNNSWCEPTGVIPPNPTCNAEGSHIGCFGADDGEINVTWSDFPGNVNIYLDGEMKVSNVETSPYDISGLTAGEYDVTIEFVNDSDINTECSATVTQESVKLINLTCGSENNLGPCYSDDEIGTSFYEWLENFSVSGGTEPLIISVNGQKVDDLTVEILSSFIYAPDACGGSVTISVVVTDACGLQAACEGTFNVAADEEPPVFSNLPYGGSIPCNPETLPTCAAFAESEYPVTATDNCSGNVEVTCLAGDIVEGEYCLKSQTFTFTAEDDCGNVATAEVTYNWLESTDTPFFVNLPEGGDLGCNPETLPVCASDVSVSYVCGGGDYGINCYPGDIVEDGCLRTQTFIYTAAGLDCYPEFSETVTYTWKEDLVPPVIFTDATNNEEIFDCNPPEAPVFTGLDNCDGVFTPVVTTKGPQLLILEETSCKIYSQTWTANYTDDCGNKAEPKEITYYWYIDEEAPVFTECPTQPIDLGCNPGHFSEQIVINAAGDILEDCRIKEVWGNSLPITNEGCLYTQIWTVKAQDYCENIGTCEVTIIWTKDNEAPTFANCPTEPIDLGCNPQVLPNADMAIEDVGPVTDNCDTDVSVTAIGGEITGTCLKSQTWTVTADPDCGPDATCQVTYTWTDDTTPPVWNQEMPGDITVDCGEVPAFPSGITASDICDENVEVYISEEDWVFNICGYEIIRTFVARDDCWNITVHEQTITVNPAPVAQWVDAPGAITTTCAEAGTLQPSRLVYDNFATGDCWITSGVLGEITGSFTACGGKLFQDWTFTDECGRTISHQQIITVLPAPEPVLTIPNLSMFPETMSCSEANNWEELLGGYLYAYYSNSESGDCLIFGEVGPTVSENWTLCEGGTLTFVWEATDVCEYHMEYTHVINVLPAAPPDISVPTLPDNLSCAETEAFLSGTILDATYTNIYDEDNGNCLISGSIVADVVEVWNLCSGGTITVTFDGADICQNPLYYTKTINVAPAAEPVLTIPSDLPTVLSCADADAFMTPADATYSNDDVGGCEINGYIPAEVTHNWNLCYGGTIEVVYAGADECGFEMSKSWTITVEQAPPAAFIDPPTAIRISCDKYSSFETSYLAYSNTSAGKAVASCLIEGDVLGVISGEYDACGGSLVQTWTFTDVCGRTIIYEQPITIYDDVPPVIAILSDINLDECNEEWPESVTTTWSDNCSAGGTVTGVPGEITTEACSQFRYYAFNAEDDCGNPAEEVLVKVTRMYDETPPDFVVPEAYTVNRDADCLFDTSPAVTGWPTDITDNCDPEPQVSYLDKIPVVGDCASELIFTRFWKVVDGCGNVTEKLQTIIITDNTPPILVGCQDDFTICEDEMVDWITIPTATDNCDTEVQVTWVRSDGVTDDLNAPFTDLITTITFTAIDDCGNPASCEMTVTIEPCSRIELLKTSNLVIDPTLNWSFVLYKGSFGGLMEISSETTLAVEDGILFRNAGPLSRHNTYTVCELEVPAGYGTTWMIDSNGDGVFELITYTTTPGTAGVYNPNSVDVPPQDLGNRCYEMAGSLLPANIYGETPLALQLHVNNTFPGGDARTPGYWKNWNTCTGGGQQYTATENADDQNFDGVITAFDRVMSGWALLDDIIELYGISWGDFELTTCEDAQKILDNRDLEGVNHASDPAYNLAKHLLAYQLNQGAGAYICPDMIGIETEAVNLLVALGFNGTGNYLNKPKTPIQKQQASLALKLGAILDAYNNNLGCEGLAEMISGVPPTPPPSDPTPLSCTTTVTNIVRKKPGKVVVNAVGGTSPYQYKIGDDAFQDSNEFTIANAGTYTFTVTDSSDPMQNCACEATVTSTKSGEIEFISGISDSDVQLEFYPNPFSDMITFQFVAKEDARARLEIINLTGQRVALLIDGPVEQGVTYQMEFNPKDLVSQILIYRLIINDVVKSGRILYNKY